MRTTVTVHFNNNKFNSHFLLKSRKGSKKQIVGYKKQQFIIKYVENMNFKLNLAMQL